MESAVKKKARRRAYYLRNRERENAASREYKRANSGAIAEKMIAYRAANRAVIAASTKEWYAANRERKLATASAHYQTFKARHRNNQRRRLTGVMPTRPEPELCECCGRPPGKQAMNLDHCHLTGIFRGWLCGQCNTSIGKLGDTIAGVMRAVRYLERAYAKTP